MIITTTAIIINNKINNKNKVTKIKGEEGGRSRKH